jgi:hypothetical protein
LAKVEAAVCVQQRAVFCFVEVPGGYERRYGPDREPQADDVVIVIPAL